MARRRKRKAARDLSAVGAPVPTAGAVTPTQGAAAIPDEPAFSTPEESPETDVAPEVLDRGGIGRRESLETDAAPSVIDQDAPAAAAAPDPDTCSEPERDRTPADDLH